MEVKEIPQQTQTKFLTLSQLSEKIRSVLARGIATEWVQAEIVKMNLYPDSGHCFPDLVEKENGTVRAKMKSVIWEENFILLNGKFKNVTKENLSEGMKVLLKVKVNYHALYGLKLDIVDIEPSFTLGEMMLTRRRTIARLHAEDSINRNKLLAFPLLPKRIAIISSETNAGYKDFVSKISKRKEFALVHELFSSHIDGDVAISEIISRLATIKQRLNQFDVVAIIRGGDNAIGLHCYDNYELAKTVALFPIPVITGISHATSDTVVEMVAHASKITPTDLAYFLIEKFEAFEERITTAKRKLQGSLEKRLRVEKQRIAHSQEIFTTHARRIVDVKRVELNSLRKTFVRSASSFFERAKANLERSSNSLRYKPSELVKQKKNELISLLSQFEKNFKHKFKLEQVKLDGIEKEVKHKSPETILARGYSITFHDGVPVKDSSKVKDGSVLRTQVHNGEIISHVKIEKP